MTPQKYEQRIQELEAQIASQKDLWVGLEKSLTEAEAKLKEKDAELKKAYREWGIEISPSPGWSCGHPSCVNDGDGDCRVCAELSLLRQENERYRKALEKINMGRHGELNTVQMALIAWEALEPKEGK